MGQGHRRFYTPGDVRHGRAYRIQRVLARLSRDRWLSPDEIKRTIERLYRCITTNPRARVPYHVLPAGWMYGGVLRGACPIAFDRVATEAEFDAITSALTRASKHPGRAELVILAYHAGFLGKRGTSWILK